MWPRTCCCCRAGSWPAICGDEPAGWHNGVVSEPTNRFKRRSRVEATEDLPGVPAGTRGRVMTEAGFTWIRYFVQFDNGVELSGVDATHLIAVPKR